jgi:hypothetical protein
MPIPQSLDARRPGRAGLHASREVPVRGGWFVAQGFLSHWIAGEFAGHFSIAGRENHGEIWEGLPLFRGGMAHPTAILKKLRYTTLQCHPKLEGEPLVISFPKPRAIAQVHGGVFGIRRVGHGGDLALGTTGLMEPGEQGM